MSFDNLSNKIYENTEVNVEKINNHETEEYQIIYKKTKEGTLKPYLSQIKKEAGFISQDTILFLEENEAENNLSVNLLPDKYDLKDFIFQKKEIIRKNMKKARELNNITQKEMAEKCNLTKNHISAIERGIYDPSLECLLTYSFVLNKPISYFFQEEEAVISTEINQIFNSVNKIQQQKILDILKIFIS